MPDRAARAVLTLSLTLGAAALAGAQAPPAPLGDDALARALDLVQQNYLKPVARPRLLEGALQGMLRGLDPYSDYLGPEEWAGLQQGLAGQFGGIGARLELDATARCPRVLDLMAGSSGAEAGVARGDLILEVDGRHTEGLPIEQAIQMIRGPVDSVVRLSVRREGAVPALDLSVRRRAVKTPSVLGHRRDAEGRWDHVYDERKGIGYVRIAVFAEDTVADLEQAMAGLQARGCRGLVLDLRDNIGGLLRAAVGAADLFLDSGRIISEKGRDGTEEFHDARPGTYTALPIVVLANGNTRSAGEILAAALQDHRRAVVVGQRTFGKGYVQKLFPLGDGLGGLTLTIASYQRPSGKGLDRHDAPKGSEDWGVSPDPGLEVVMTEEEYQAWLKQGQAADRSSAPAAETAPAFKDRVLERALEVLAGPGR
jgi:carboxyl-terminal processing protease